MKGLHVQESNYYRTLEKRDDYCMDVLKNQMSIIRFDVIEERQTTNVMERKEIETLQRWRAKISLDDEDNIVIEMKDYYDNSRHTYPLPNDIRFSDAMAQVLGIAWAMVEDEEVKQDH